MPKKPTRTMREAINIALKAGKSNSEVLALVKKSYNTNMGIATINLHRNQLRKNDSSIKTDREARKLRGG